MPNLRPLSIHKTFDPTLRDACSYTACSRTQYTGIGYYVFTVTSRSSHLPTAPTIGISIHATACVAISGYLVAAMVLVLVREGGFCCRNILAGWLVRVLRNGGVEAGWGGVGWQRCKYLTAEPDGYHD